MDEQMEDESKGSLKIEIEFDPFVLLHKKLGAETKPGIVKERDCILGMIDELD